MVKKPQQTVATPTIDKLVAAHEASDKADKVAQQPKPHYVIYLHPLFIVWRIITQSLVLLPFVFLLLVLLPTGVNAFETLLAPLVLVLILLSIIVNNYIYWILNVALVYPKTLQLFYFKNLLRQRTESFEISRLNAFDVLRKGVLTYFFNYGSINLSTIVKEVDSTEKLMIKNVYKPDQALNMIKYYAQTK